MKGRHPFIWHRVFRHLRARVRTPRFAILNALSSGFAKGCVVVIGRHVPRLRAGLAVVLVALLAVVGSIALAPSASAAPASTSVALAFSPTGPVDPFTLVSFHAVVTPRTAPGSIRFLANGVAIASGEVTGGDVALTTTMLPVGDLTIVAEYVPSDARVFAPSRSAQQPLVVVTQPRAWLLTSSGSAVPAGGQVRVPSTVQVDVDGFAADSVVSVELGGTSVGTAIRTGSDGTGSARFAIPASLGSRVYVMTAKSGSLTTSFVFYIYNPFLVPTTPPTTPPPGSPAVAPVSATVQHGGIPSTGRTPSLAHTGTDAVSMLPLGLMLLLVGGLLMRAQPLVAGLAGRHAVSTGRHRAA